MQQRRMSPEQPPSTVQDGTPARPSPASQPPATYAHEQRRAAAEKLVRLLHDADLAQGTDAYGLVLGYVTSQNSRPSRGAPTTQPLRTSFIQCGSAVSPAHGAIHLVVLEHQRFTQDVEEKLHSIRRYAGVQLATLPAPSVTPSVRSGVGRLDPVEQELRKPSATFVLKLLFPGVAPRLQAFADRYKLTFSMINPTVIGIADTGKENPSLWHVSDGPAIRPPNLATCSCTILMDGEFVRHVRS